MPFEILIIDDKIAAGEQYASLVHEFTQVEAIAVDNPNAAIETLTHNPIKVVILDQRMPAKKGTELYADLKAVDSRIKVLMLSGEATTQEWYEANKLGYDDYLHKSKIKELPIKAHALYVRYFSDILAPGDLFIPIKLLTESRGVWPFREKVEYFLSGANILDEEFIFPESWRTVKQINAGEKVTETDKIEIETKFKYQSAIEAKGTHSAGASLGHIVKLQSKLETELSTKFSTEVSTGTKRQREITREYQLPETPPNPSQFHVASRHFERAPVYRQIRALIAKCCTCCNTTYSFPHIVYQPIARIATRHVDFFSDGKQKALLTGYEKF